MKTNGARCMLRMSVLLYTSRSDPGSPSEDIKKNILQSRLRCFWRGASCLDDGCMLLGVTIHASDASLSKCRMFTREYRVGSSACGLNSAPLISDLRQPSLLRHFVDHLWSCFVRAALILPRTYRDLRLLQIFLHKLRIVFLCLSVVMLRSLIFCAF